MNKPLDCRVDLKVEPIWPCLNEVLQYAEASKDQYKMSDVWFGPLEVINSICILKVAQIIC